MRSISRVPRCQQRNNSRLRLASRPSLDRVVPVMSQKFQSNAESPDVPGGVHIAFGTQDVSPFLGPFLGRAIHNALPPQGLTRPMGALSWMNAPAAPWFTADFHLDIRGVR